MSIEIAEETRATICKQPGLTRLAEVMDTDFQDLSLETDVEREKAALYAERNRGSVRLNAGRFYTAREFAEYVQQTKRLRLP